jgi:DNA-binding MarR family transcriptional regulator
MTTAPDTPLVVLKKFRLLFGSVRQHFREVESRCGISGSQLWILQEVHGQPAIGIGDLAAVLSIHQSTCSLLVEKLVKKGLLRKERRQDDQRRVGLVLTAAAEEMLVKAPGPAEGLLPDALQAMSATELAQLDAALSVLLDKLQSKNPRFADKPLADL